MKNDSRFKVGIRLPSWISGYASRLFEGFLDFQRTGAAMALEFDQPSGGDLPPTKIDKSWSGDGLVVYRHTKAEAKAWKQAGIQVVNLSAEIPNNKPDFPRVTIDNNAIGKLAYEHLAALGLNNFAYIHESTRIYSKLRLESFRNQVLANNGTFYQINVPASSYPIDSRPAYIEKSMTTPIKALPKPCGILVKDDIAGVWTSRILEKLNIACPTEMPLLGISDDIVFCHTTSPPLSSIPYPGRKIGYAALQLLSSMLEGDKVPGNHWFTIHPDPVIHRESTQHVILPDTIVTEALKYLRLNLPTRPVTVAELGKIVGLSTEGLRQRFIKTLGHSPKKEIERLRCHSVIEKLRSSDDTIDSIALDSGFAGSDELCRIIKRNTGKTPGQIRKESHT